MERDDNSIRRGLTEAAELAGPLEIPEHRLLRAVRHRRRTTYAAAAAVCCALAGAASSIPALTHGSTGHTTTPATRSTSPGSNPFQRQERTFDCGGTIAPPLAQPSPRDAVQIHVSTPQQTPAGPPRVAVTFAATRATSISVPLAPTPARILLLRGGKIVAGQDLPETRSSAGGATPSLNGDQLGVARARRLTPGEPYIATLTLSASAVCGKSTWQDLWSAGDVQLAVVASYDALTHHAPLSPDTPNPDPLIVLTQQLP